jgi:cobalt-zinc-cadmium efflux system protein
MSLHVHSHAPGHVHDAPDGADTAPRTSLGNARRLGFVFALVALYTVAEVLGGLYTGSLALLADAGHMLSDVAALGIALTAIWLARRPATQKRTFGLYRAEVLGALINGVALVVIAVFIFVEALERFREPPAVLGGPMMLVALGGLLVNLTGLLILRDGHRHSLNVHGAWLHMVADTLGSAGTMVSAFFIWRFGLLWFDPAASVLIACLVLWSSLSLIRETIEVLMESAPARLDLAAVADSIAADGGVQSVHDLHAWTIGTGKEALTAHVVATEGHGRDEVLTRLCSMLRDRFGLTHVTLQVEREDGHRCDCECPFEGAANVDDVSTRSAPQAEPGRR